MDTGETTEHPGRGRSENVNLSRTWELELFISGATVFALLQASGVVDDWWARTDPHLADPASMGAFFAYYYAKLMLYTLIATFLIHLVARAYWVAMIGLHSVFPGGVRWDELKLGPAFLETYRSRLPSMENSIRRLDDVSTLLFVGGAVVLLTFGFSVVLVVALGALALLISSVFLGGSHVVAVGTVLLIVVSTVPAIGKAIDAARGRKRGPDARPSRGLRVVALASYHLGGMTMLGPLSLVMATNLGRRRSKWLMALVFGGIVGTFVVRDILMGNDMLRADSHLYLPDQRPAQYADPAFYEDRRSAGEVFPTLPSIQSEVIRGPYLRLFIPVTPDRHNDVVAERCPEVPEFDSGIRLAPVRPDPEPPDVSLLIACLARLQPVSLDGARLDGLGFRITTDAKSGLRGLLAFIPVSMLQPGEHLLRVEGLPRPEPPPGREPRRPRPATLIPFWI